MYLLLEATSTVERPISHGDFARLISPTFPRRLNGYLKCLFFAMNVHGQHIGRVSILDDHAQSLYDYVGSKEQNENLKQWVAVSVQLDSRQTLFVLEGTRGGESVEDSEGDICIDDFALVLGLCCKIKVNSIKYDDLTHSYLRFSRYRIDQIHLYYIDKSMT